MIVLHKAKQVLESRDLCIRQEGHKHVEHSKAVAVCEAQYTALERQLELWYVAAFGRLQ